MTSGRIALSHPGDAIPEDDQLTGQHASHPDVIKRLKRAHGHLASVIAMIEAGRSCLDISQQLHAVEQAVSQAKRVLIHDHVDHCLGEAADKTGLDQRRALEGFKAITKYL